MRAVNIVDNWVSKIDACWSKVFALARRDQCRDESNFKILDATVHIVLINDNTFFGDIALILDQWE